MTPCSPSGRRPALCTGLALALVLAGGGCSRLWSNDRVEVAVSLAPEIHQPVRHVNLIVGGERMSWAELGQDAPILARFLPTPDHDGQVTLLYEDPSAAAGARRQSWTGPKIAPSRGYRIDIVIHAGGKVLSRHCMLPCDLD